MMVSHTRSKAMLFCEGSSIRGMQKIIKARTRCLRMLWILFVFIMTSVLLVTSVFLVLDYLNYDTAWHKSKKMDIKPPFPSITVCSHNPFSTRANRLWKEGRVMSPTELSDRLVKMSLEGLKYQNDLLASSSLFDKIETYYTAIRPNETIMLGHDRSQMRYCMVVKNGFNIVSENCTGEDRMDMRLIPFSHPLYLNCWTLEGVNDSRAMDIEYVILLVAVTPTYEISELKYNFVMDMLSRGEGLILTIHQRGKYPDIIRDGLSVEPGKMNEFTYDTTKWKRLSTPKTRCYDNQEKIVDMNNEFIYSFRQCLESHLQRYLISKCSCMNIYWPRVVPVSEKVPYCMLITKNSSLWVQRVQCASGVVENISVVQKTIENKKCFPRCHYMEYDLSPSITKWNPSGMKLEILTRRYRTFEDASNKMTEETKQRYSQALEGTVITQNSSTYGELFTSDRFCFVKLKRRNFDLTVNVEKLVFDLNILASRIGGLCSLCIGLTAAFVMELVEFMYLYFQMPKLNGSPAAGDNAASGGHQASGFSDNQYFSSSSHKYPTNSQRCKDHAHEQMMPGYPSTVSHRSRAFNYNTEEEHGSDIMRLTGYDGQFGVSNNHYSDSPWFRMTSEGPCHACGRGCTMASPISSV